jgi:uncharacterized protein (DUF2235 family)
MKRFVICLDGTWQQLRQDKLTNIGIIARSVGHTTTTEAGEKVTQIVIYSQGVGANTQALGKSSLLGRTSNAINRMAGGIFGEGLEDVIVDTYLRLAFNYEHGDEIYIFGFSRGAFAARSLAGLINCSGIVSRLHADRAWDAFALYRTPLPKNGTEDQKREHFEAQRQFRRLYGKGKRAEDGARVALDEPPPITYMGIFDTVGQRGMPDALGWLSDLFNRRYGFHNLNICPNVQSARHAVAIDEQRLGFPPTLWDNVDDANKSARQRPGADASRRYYEQRWFVGAHGDVGGGNDSPLSAPPLKWIAEGAAACGLRFYDTYGSDESPMSALLRDAGLKFDAPITRPTFWKSLSPMNYPVYTRRIWSRKEHPSDADADMLIDATVAMRSEALSVRPRYRPAALRPFKKVLRMIAARVLKPDELRP